MKLLSRMTEHQSKYNHFQVRFVFIGIHKVQSYLSRIKSDRVKIIVTNAPKNLS